MIFFQGFEGSDYLKIKYRGFKFDAETKFIGTPSLDFTGDMFFSLWFYPEELAVSTLLSSRFVIKEGNVYGWYVRTHGEGTVSFVRGNGTDTPTAADLTNKYKAGRWNHLAVSVNTSTGELTSILNGKLSVVNISSDPIAYSSAEITSTIGTNNLNDQDFIGTMSQVIMGEGTLTSDSLSNLTFGNQALPYSELPLELLSKVDTSYSMHSNDDSLLDKSVSIDRPQFDLVQSVPANQPTLNDAGYAEFNGTQHLTDAPIQTGDFTYGIEFDTVETSFQPLIASSQNQIQIIFIKATTGAFVFRTSQNVLREYSDINFADGISRTVTFTREGNIFTLYVDGVSVYSVVDSGDLLIDWIGSRNGLGSWFIGNIYNTIIYPTSLDASEIAAVSLDTSLADYLGAVAIYDFTESLDLIPGQSPIKGWVDEGLGPIDNLTQPSVGKQPVHDPDTGAAVFNSSVLEGAPTQSGDFTYSIEFESTSAAAQAILADSSDITRFLALNSSNIRYKSTQGINRDVPLLYNGTGKHVVTVTKSSSDLKIYIEGSNPVSFTDTGTVTFDLIGDRDISSPLPLIGSMFYIHVYPTALDATQVLNVTTDPSLAESLGAVAIYDFSKQDSLITDAQGIAGWSDQAVIGQTANNGARFGNVSADGQEITFRAIDTN